MVYQITNYTRDKARQLGLNVKPSSKGFKKIDVFKDGKLIASIGDNRYLDYPNYIKTKGLEYANERRRLYHLRNTSELGRLLW
jgi:hypothetical protein